MGIELVASMFHGPDLWRLQLRSCFSCMGGLVWRVSICLCLVDSVRFVVVGLEQSWDQRQENTPMPINAGRGPGDHKGHAKCPKV